MSAFSTAFSDFCDGHAALPQLIAVLRDDLLRGQQAAFDDASLIDRAWRSGRVDREVYETLRDTITNFDISASRPGVNDSNWEEIRVSRDDWHMDALDPVRTDDDATLLRPSLNSPIVTGGRQSTPWPSSPSHPASWSPTPAQPSSSTGSPHWSDAPAREVGTGTVLKERFVLEEIIGRGGMGTVFKALDIRKEEAQDRHPYVAVKVLNEDFRRHPEAFKALQREAKKSQSLAHPNVASVHDFDRDGATVFLVMELLEGESLETLIRNRAGRGLPSPEVMRIVRGAGAALAYAHQKGVVHSDFKPANVIRTRDGTIKVLDFGIARATARPSGPSDGRLETTRFNVASLHALTPAYASCEMLMGDQAHPSDDVFALACVTYELLAGRHPFGQQPALLAERRGIKPIPIERIGRRTWRALAAGLAFSRAERTPSVEAFLRALEVKRRVNHALAAGAVTVAVSVVGIFMLFPSLPDLNPLTLLPSFRGTPPGTAETTREKSAVPTRSEQLAPPDPLPPAAPLTAEVAPKRIETGQSDAHEVGKGQPTIAPPAVEESVPRVAPPPRPAEPRAFSVDQLKARVIAFARVEEVPDALATYRELQEKLGPDDDFVRRDAPQEIAQAYARLSERQFQSGNYPAASALLERAQEMVPDSTAYAERRNQIREVAKLEQQLAEAPVLSAGVIQQQLTEIRQREGSQYITIRSRLAGVLAQRIQSLQESQPGQANQLLEVGHEAFAGSSAIESLAPIETGDEASSTEPGAHEERNESRL
ncbi:MAG TPA: serine/threonine-protein kinase [Steroidobacteraceae bacterium]|nr:serine/threonine-protein kinase [Steroidobacteraceae bacterium]